MDGYLQLLQFTFNNLSFDFRTTLNDSFLMAGFDATGAVLTVQINMRKLEIVVNEPGVVVDNVAVLDKMVTDGKWYRITLSPNKSTLAVSLIATDYQGTAKPETTLMELTGVFFEGYVFTEVFFGGLEQRARLTGANFK